MPTQNEAPLNAVTLTRGMTLQVMTAAPGRPRSTLALCGPETIGVGNLNEPAVDSAPMANAIRVSSSNSTRAWNDDLISKAHSRSTCVVVVSTKSAVPFFTVVTFGRDTASVRLSRLTIFMSRSPKSLARTNDSSSGSRERSAVPPTLDDCPPLKRVTSTSNFIEPES